MKLLRALDHIFLDQSLLKHLLPFHTIDYRNIYRLLPITMARAQAKKNEPRQTPVLKDQGEVLEAHTSRV